MDADSNTRTSHDVKYGRTHSRNSSGTCWGPVLLSAVRSSKYKSWLKENVPSEAGDAELIYGLRCSLLHQGRAFPHGSVFPLAFTYSPTGGFHNFSTVVNGEQVGWVDTAIFIREMTSGAEKWLRTYEGTNTVEGNLDKFARLRPEGLPPHVVGMPVIA